MAKQTSTTIWRAIFATLCLTLLVWGMSRVTIPSHLSRKAIQVLCYHDIAVKPTNRFARTPTQLAADFEMLSREEMQVVPLDDLIQHLQTNKPIPKNWLIITFDDASKGQFDFARPLLKKYGFHATFFIPTKSVVNNSPVSTRYSGVMNWQQLEILKEEGFALESHGHSHHSFSRLSSGQIEQDIGTSLNILRQKLDINSHNLCLPYGEYQPENELSFLKMALKSIALTTTDHGPGQESLVKIHRYEVHANSSPDELLKIIRP